jgi:hypothetical protein
LLLFRIVGRGRIPHYPESVLRGNKKAPAALIEDYWKLTAIPVR